MNFNYIHVLGILKTIKLICSFVLYSWARLKSNIFLKIVIVFRKHLYETYIYLI